MRIRVCLSCMPPTCLYIPSLLKENNSELHWQTALNNWRLRELPGCVWVGGCVPAGAWRPAPAAAGPAGHAHAAHGAVQGGVLQGQGHPIPGQPDPQAAAGAPAVHLLPLRLLSFPLLKEEGEQERAMCSASVRAPAWGCFEISGAWGPVGWMSHPPVLDLPPCLTSSSKAQNPKVGHTHTCRLAAPPPPLPPAGGPAGAARCAVPAHRTARRGQQLLHGAGAGRGLDQLCGPAPPQPHLPRGPAAAPGLQRIAAGPRALVKRLAGCFLTEAVAVWWCGGLRVTGSCGSPHGCRNLPCPAPAMQLQQLDCSAPLQVLAL